MTREEALYVLHELRTDVAIEEDDELGALLTLLSYQEIELCPFDG